MPTTGMKVDAAALRAQASQIETIRESVSPARLPLGFDPAGKDIVSCGAATRVSASAAEAANALWQSWSHLGDLASRIRAVADGYSEQNSVVAGSLSGGGASHVVGLRSGPPVPAPMAIPQVYAGSTGTPEEISELLRSGTGQQGPERFSQQWSAHATAVRDSAAQLRSVSSVLSGSWEGPAADSATSEIGSAVSSLERHAGRVESVGRDASTHAMDWRQAERGTHRPSQFKDLHDNVQAAWEANARSGNMMPGAVAQAQGHLSNAQGQTAAAYGEYAGVAVDPVTGDLIDPETGERIDLAKLGLTPEELDALEGDGSLGELGADDPMASSGAQMLSGMLSAVVGGVGSGVGAVMQAGQQGAQQVASQVGQLAKAIGQGGQSSSDGLGSPDLGGSEFSGGGGAGGGGGETLPAAAPAAPPPVMSPASTLGVAAPVTVGSAGGSSAAGAGSPMMGGFPMGMAPGGGGAGPGAQGGGKVVEEGKKVMPKSAPNSERVIGEVATDRARGRAERGKDRLAAEMAAAKEGFKNDA
ncbi:PPE domain-containing protein [Mycobacteroides abscessus]|nr:PPE domain-containing protein [Mycobacteroides abscessus]